MRWWVSGSGKDGEVQCLMGTISVWRDEDIAEMMDGNGGSTLMCSLPLNCSYKGKVDACVCYHHNKVY